MRKRYLASWTAVIVLLFVLISPMFADNLSDIFQQANQAYRSEKYQEAADLYQKILSQGYESAEVYFNLGNCFYRLGEIGKSVLYYEKARRLNPHDPDIQYNLELANLKVIDRIEMPPRFFLFDWWDAVKTYYSVPQLTRLLIIIFALTILFLIAWLYLKRDRVRRLMLSASLLLGLVTIFYAYILVIRIQEQKEHREAIVLSPSVTVLSAPDENSTDMFVLHEGVKVHLDEQRDVWVKISLPDGKTGWMKSDVLGII